MDKYDLIVIGAGPGGYVAAIRAAQKGMKVACIEKRKTLGGTCLNVGCIPSKTLLHSTELYHKLATQGKEQGIECEALKANLTQMMKRKEGVVSKLAEGIEYLFKKNKITWVHGEATFTSPQQIKVSSNGKSQTLEATHFILATGSEPISLPFLPIDEKHIVTSTGALSLKKVPKKLILIGAGVIGLELGSVYQRLGAEVEVIELLDRPTPGLDKEISRHILQIFQKEGMTFHLSAKVVDAKKKKDQVVLTVEHKDGQAAQHSADVVLVGIGRRPYTQNLGLDKIGVKTNKKGEVEIDAQFRTSLPHIFAIGDLIDGPMLAHKASEEGIAVADLISGQTICVNYLTIPNVMYTMPEVACVGLSEEEARAAGLEITIGKSSLKANSRARCTGDEEGLVKLIQENKSKRLIGMHIIAPHASEMIGEGVIALEKKMTIEELAHASHAHPTLSESIKEAALALLKQAIHQ